jgi:pyrroloquinoline quinone biosynthesis protein B
VIIKVLGSAAGGGVPQANCNCRNCLAVRAGELGLRPRTQTSLAVSRDGRQWVVVDASPDLRQQILVTPELWPSPAAGARSSPIAAVVLTSAEVDRVAGLLALREGFSFALYATPRVLGILAANPIFDVLRPDRVSRIAINPGMTVELSPIGLLQAFAVPGKVPLYLEQGGREAQSSGEEGDVVGLEIRDPATGAAFAYVPGCAKIEAALAARLSGLPLVFFDGTLYGDDELIAQGLADKTGQRMGHVSMAGPGGSLRSLASIAVKRRVYIHLNNSNPVLRKDSAERAAVERAGWEVAEDGMEIEL